MPSTSRRILFLAGDTSGDIHCGLLARELMRRRPDWKLLAAGGEHLRGAGCRMVADTSNMGVIGVPSALALLPRALWVRRQVLETLEKDPPDAAVLCDWGAFNARLLPTFKEKGVRTLYYFPPRSWQKEGTAGLAIAPLCDRIATPFSWSAQRLNAAGGRAEWVGHPLLEAVHEAPGRDETRAKLNIAPGEILVALLPGSRDLELKIIAPAMAGASRFVAKRMEAGGRKIRFVAAVPKGKREHAQSLMPFVEVRVGEASSLLKACDAAIVKSGTATLEASVAGAPQVVCYDVPPLVRAQWNLTLARKMRHVSMPNIIVGREIVPELLGDRCNAWDLARALESLLDDPARADLMREGYREVRRALGEDLPVRATQKTAQMVEELVDSTGSST